MGKKKKSARDLRLVLFYSSRPYQVSSKDYASREELNILCRRRPGAIPLFLFTDHSDCVCGHKALELRIFLSEEDGWLYLKLLSVFSHILYEICILHVSQDYSEKWDFD